MKVRAPFVVFIYVIAANIPLWAASRFLGCSLIGLFNIEFVAIGILSLYVSRWLSACLLLAVMVLDLVYCIGKTYMLSPGDLVASARSALFLVPSHGWSIAGITVAIMAVCFLTVLAADDSAERGERKPIVLALAGLALLGVAVDCGGGKVSVFHPDSQQGEYRMIRNTFHRLLMDEMRLQTEKRRTFYGAGSAMAGASMKPMEVGSVEGFHAESNVRPNVVFVVVESWGKPLAKEIDESLMGPYMRAEVGKSYSVSVGTVPFHGATVSGELRELCSNTLGLAVIAAPASKLMNCLPERFEGMGYHTIAVHGFEGAMFERSSWYRKIRFEETWFRSQLKEKDLPECPGPFPGICDAAISNWIDGRLQEDGKEPQFIYWLTLNSHLPVPVFNAVKDPPSCSGSAVLSDDAICAWYRLIFNVHRSVSDLAMRQVGRPTVFVVVGDHAPPFSSERRREEFSGSAVPYVLLWPKCEGCQPSRLARVVAAVPQPSHRLIRRLAHGTGGHMRGSGA